MSNDPGSVTFMQAKKYVRCQCTTCALPIHSCWSPPLHILYIFSVQIKVHRATQHDSGYVISTKPWIARRCDFANARQGICFIQEPESRSIYVKWNLLHELRALVQMATCFLYVYIKDLKSLSWSLCFKKYPKFIAFGLCSWPVSNNKYTFFANISEKDRCLKNWSPL